jgi:hypothetical protein
MTISTVRHKGLCIVQTGACCEAVFVSTEDEVRRGNAKGKEGILAIVHHDEETGRQHATMVNIADLCSIEVSWEERE